MKSSQSVLIGERVRIFPRGKKGTYCAEFWLDGKHVRRSLRTLNSKVARQRAVKLDMQISSGTIDLSRSGHAKLVPTTIEQAVKDFIEFKKTEGRRRKTTTKYRGVLNTFIEFASLRGVNTVRDITLVFTLHSLRSSFKTICIHAGVPREVVDAWQDHAPDRAASNRYYKLSDEESQKFISKVPFGDGVSAADADETQTSRGGQDHVEICDDDDGGRTARHHGGCRQQDVGRHCREHECEHAKEIVPGRNLDNQGARKQHGLASS